MTLILKTENTHCTINTTEVKGNTNNAKVILHIQGLVYLIMDKMYCGSREISSKIRNPPKTLLYIFLISAPWFLAKESYL